MSEKKYIARTKNKHIISVIDGSLHFKTYELATERLNLFRNLFIVSRKTYEDNNDDAIILWIKGYAITGAEKKQGYLGNFARIGFKRENNFYKFYIEKVPENIGKHPQKKRPKRDVPNFSHPILRAINKGRVYANERDAWLELKQLHEEFPKVTVPGPLKLFTMIYSKQHGSDPIRRYILEIIPVEDETEQRQIRLRKNPVQGRLKREQVDEMYDDLYLSGAFLGIELDDAINHKVSSSAMHENGTESSIESD